MNINDRAFSRSFLTVAIPLILMVAAIGFLNLNNRNLPCNDTIYSTEESLPKDKSLVCHVDLDGQHDHLPSWIFGLNNLRTLNANGTNLQDIPAEIASLKTLEELNIAHDSLKHIDNALGKLKNIKRLYISGDDMNEFPLAITKLKNLEELIYLSPKDTTRTPPELANLTRLKRLTLRQGDYRDFLMHLSKLKNLEHLTLIGGRNDKMPDDLGALTKLKSLSVQMINLERLPESITQLRGLETLRIGSSRFFDLPKNIGDLTNLKELVISGVPKTAYAVTSQGTIDDFDIPFYPENTYEGRLVDLTPNENENNIIIKAPISWLPESIGNLSNLKKLYITRTKLDTLPKTISNLTNLEELSFQKDKLTVLDTDFSRMTKLTLLNISDNPITEISDSITALPALKQFSAIHIATQVPNIHRRELIVDKSFAESYYIYGYQPQQEQYDTTGRITIERQNVKTGDIETLATFNSDGMDAKKLFAYHEPTGQLTYSTEGGIQSYNVVSKQSDLLYITTSHSQDPDWTKLEASNLKWSGSGKYLSVGGSLLNLTEGTALNRVLHDPKGAASGDIYWSLTADRYVDIARDTFFGTGTSIAVSLKNNLYSIHDITRTLKLPAGSFQSAAMSSDGNRIAFTYAVFESAYDPSTINELRLYTANADGSDLNLVYHANCRLQECTSDVALEPYFIPGAYDILFREDNDFKLQRYNTTTKKITPPIVAEEPLYASDALLFTKDGDIAIQKTYGFKVDVYDSNFKTLLFENSTPTFVDTTDGYTAIYVPLGFAS